MGGGGGGGGGGAGKDRKDDRERGNGSGEVVVQGEMERMIEKGVMGVGEESGMGGWGGQLRGWDEFVKFLFCFCFFPTVNAFTRWVLVTLCLKSVSVKRVFTHAQL